MEKIMGHLQIQISLWDFHVDVSAFLRGDVKIKVVAIATVRGGLQTAQT